MKKQDEYLHYAAHWAAADPFFVAHALSQYCQVQQIIPIAISRSIGLLSRRLAIASAVPLSGSGNGKIQLGCENSC